MIHQRLRLMRANLLVDFVKRMCPKSHASSSSSRSPQGHKSTRLVLDAASIDKKKLLKAEIDLKYMDILKNFSWVKTEPQKFKAKIANTCV